MTDRRQLLCALAAWALPGLPRAQPAARVQRLCWVGTAWPGDEDYNKAFVARLTELGLVEGRNLSTVFTLSLGRLGPGSDLPAELVRSKCDAYFAPGSELNLRVVKQAGGQVPIIIVANDYDPLGAGHVVQMARPGGRITGVSQLQLELPAKRLEVLKELLPKIRRVAVLADVSTAGQLRVTRAAAVQLGIELLVHEFQAAPYDYAAAFNGFVRAKADAVLVLTSGLFVPARKLLPELALKHRLPSMFNNGRWAESGGLLSYGPNFSASYRRAAEQMAQVLGGANPGDMPIEQPNAVEMVLNLTTAKALGLVPPMSIRLRADRLID